MLGIRYEVLVRIIVYNFARKPAVSHGLLWRYSSSVSYHTRPRVAGLAAPQNRLLEKE